MVLRHKHVPWSSGLRETTLERKRCEATHPRGNRAQDSDSARHFLQVTGVHPFNSCAQSQQQKLASYLKRTVPSCFYQRVCPSQSRRCHWLGTHTEIELQTVTRRGTSTRSLECTDNYAQGSAGTHIPGFILKVSAQWYSPSVPPPPAEE